RTSRIQTIPAIDWLSMYVACPVSSGGSSFRRTRLPTNVCVAAMRPLPSRPHAGQTAGRVEDRCDDVLIPRAAAEVPFERFANLFFRRRGVLLQEARGRHDHPRRAVAALQAMVAAEGFL